MRAARGEPAGRGDRHHHRSARARHPAVRRASRPVGPAGRRSGPSLACRRRGAAVRAGHAVYGANLPGPGRASRRDLPGRHDRGDLRRTSQPGRRGGGGVRHHRDPRRPAAYVRRRDALLPGFQPGPGRTGRGFGVPRATYPQPRPRRSGAAGRGRRHLRNRQAPDHLVGPSPGEPRARRHITSPSSSAASTSPRGLPMQAPVRGGDWRSLNVPARLPGRTSVPVLSLELARDGEPHSDAGAGTVTGGAVRARRTLVLAVCCLSLFMVGLDNTIVNVGLPSIGRDLHAGVSGLQWTIAAYTVTLAALLMFSGAIADRIGRRTIFQVGLSLFTLGSWLCSLAPTLGALIGFRILQGVGGSMLNPAALGIITNTFTGRAERARAIGVWDGVFGLSMARDLLGQHSGGPGRHLTDRAVRAGLQGATVPPRGSDRPVPDHRDARLARLRDHRGPRLRLALTGDLRLLRALRGRAGRAARL